MTSVQKSARTVGPKSFALLAMLLAAACVGIATSFGHRWHGAASSVVAPTILSEEDSSATPLGATPILMSHDSMTGYPHEGAAIGTCAQYQCQTIGLSGQLDCGVRAFDIRVYSNGGKYSFVHGPGKQGKDPLNHFFEGDLCGVGEEVVNWANANPDELVILFYNHLSGDTNDWSDYIAKLKACPKVASIHGNCDSDQQLGSMPMGEVMKHAKVPGGDGHVLAIFDGCLGDNYGVFTDATPSKGLDFLDDKTKQVLDGKPDGKLYMVQRQFQWELSSPILNANRDADLNVKTAEKWKSEALKKGGLWLADNVCQGGTELAKAFGHTVTKEQEEKCKASCDASERKCE